MTKPQAQLTPDQMAKLDAIRDKFNEKFLELRKGNPNQSFEAVLNATWGSLKAQTGLPNLPAGEAARAIGFGDL